LGYFSKNDKVTLQDSDTMTDTVWTNYKRLFVVGVNFKKADVSLRNKFAVSREQCRRAYLESTVSYLHHFIILSTCNRTEIYGFVPCHYILLQLLKSYSKGSMEEISEFSYVKEGDDAIEHFLTVAAGLDSQIPGDFEIISQIKSAFQLSKEYNKTNGYLERLVNQALQVSKIVKNTTYFSDGTLSVSYAVIQKIRNLKIEGGIKICVAGLGDIGILTLKNIRSYFPEAEVVLVNRSEDKLHEVADAFHLKPHSLNHFSTAAMNCNVLVVCTSASHPIIDIELLKGTEIQFIFDLSIPQNVSPEVYQDVKYSVMDIDTVSNEITKTVNGRQAEVPKVKKIVTEKKREFIAWTGKRDYLTLVNRVQEKLKIEPFSNRVISEMYIQHASHYLAEPGNRKKILEKICLGSFEEKTQTIAVQQVIASLQTEEYAHYTNYHEREPSCFMAGQCCYHKTGTDGAPM
jgi:glutamyl-tRNA reductase